MTAITQNLPWFIKDLGVAIVGKKCYTSLVENLDVGDVECLKYSLSKGLGIGIVVGGSIMKVPQIILIVSARSARGLSLPAYILETLSYAITLAYSFRHHFPFSTYGENLFLTLQNILITLLIIFYAPPSLTPSSLSKHHQLTLAVLSTLLSTLLLATLPASLLSLLQLTTLPLSLFSKLPQIASNHKMQSTGQLSAFAVISQVAGCLARLFTTAQEVGDALVAAGFALALVLNVILGVQMYLYWGQSGSNAFDVDGESVVHEKKHEQKYQPAAWEYNASSASVSPPPPQLHQPIASRPGASTTTSTTMSSPLGTHRIASTPPPRTPSSAGGRKWARKVD